ncbi:uncharacterized protein LOC105182002 [Harpegnathos saltator]|uniref:uncharacterized protein LOC105182002 n=1 Tax=Harpegnathos saltator TaxID=610380 RepID=UPI000591230E|nr:uncharacterized protein LOC105182002 [Harpegnathos saltator]
MNKGAPKLRTMHPAISLYEDNTIAVFQPSFLSIIDDPDNMFETPYIVSEKPLKPCEVFLVELTKRRSDIKYINLLQCCLVDRVEDPQNHRFFISLRSSYTSYPFVTQDQRERLLRKLFENQEIPQPSCSEVLFSILRRHVLSIYEKKVLLQDSQTDLLHRHLVGIFYYQLPHRDDTFIYVVDKYAVHQSQFLLPSREQKYLLIQLNKFVLQLRTLPVYDVLSLQGLCREVIFQCIRVKGKLMTKSLKKLPLPGCILERLLIYAVDYKIHTS